MIMLKRAMKQARPTFRVYDAEGAYLGSIRAADAWAAVDQWNRLHSGYPASLAG